MSVASEINRIKINIADAYTEAEAKGATMPATENSANLADTVASIPSGSSPVLEEKTATPQAIQFDVEPSPGFDGLSKVTVLAALFGIDTNSLSHFEFGIDADGLYYTDEIGGGTPIYMGVDSRGLYVTGGNANA